METVTVLSDDTFREFVSKGIAVVDLWAPWCGPCRTIAPIVEELAAEYGGRMVFGKLNIDENGRTPAEHKVMGIPTLLVFKNGSLADRIVGAVGKERIRERLVKLL